MATSKLQKPTSPTYADKSRAITFGAVTSVTPPRDGWLVAIASTNETVTVPPVVRILEGGSRIAEGIGIVTSGTSVMAGAPVKGGNTYTIEVYRTTLSGVTLY